MSGVEKKENTIKYEGVRTNNLKNINVEITKKKIIGIAGPSGSGKSSLTYGTIHQISQYEYNKLLDKPDHLEKKFVVDKYENIIPSIALKQSNKNTNPRSTIATFLGLDTDFKMIFSKTNKITPTMFSFNNPNNFCPKCEGLGYEYFLVLEKIIDYEKNILEEPFMPWKNFSSNHYQKLLLKFAEDNKISVMKKMKELTKKELELILYSESINKYKISYKQNGKNRNKSIRYVGILKELESDLSNIKQPSNKKRLEKYIDKKECTLCHGKRFNSSVLKYKFLGKDIGEYYQMEIDKLLLFLKKNKIEEENLKKIVMNVIENLKNISNSHIGYLNLNRNIPSLSGGELQRIRLVNIMSSKISDILYILDEPSSKLHVVEYKSILDAINFICNKGNSVMLIEHNPYFLKNTDYNIYIGPKSGNEGGQLLKNSIKTKSPKYSPLDIKIDKFISVKNISKNNISNLDIELPLNSITGIYGLSGSGKTTLVKEICSKIKNAKYITQKPIKGNKFSTIASYSDIFTNIRKEIGTYLNINQNLLTFNSKEGACSFCNGRGSIKYIFDFGKKEIEVKCDECLGKRYNNKALSYKYKSLNIYEILTMTIEELVEKNILKIKK